MSKLAAELKRLLLLPPPLTVAAAESLTCGHVQSLLGSVPGSSEYFVGGVTAYSLDQKVRHLGVDRAAAKRVNSVSAEVAEQMAVGACRAFSADLAVSTTGYAEPSPSDDVIVPLAYWAVAHVSGRGKTTALRSGRIECPEATRIEVQTIVAEAALTELLSYLEALRHGTT